MVSTTMKAVIISTVIALFIYLPIALDLSLSESPNFWNSFISWLKPPYLFVVINVIITIIVASSSYHQEDEEEDTLYDEYKIVVTNQQTEVIKNVDIEPEFDSSVRFQPIVVAEVLEVTNGGDETLEVLEVTNGGNETMELNQVTEESENLAPVSSGSRKPSLKGVSCKKKKKKPKKTTSMEDTWKMVKEEGKSTPLTVEVKKRALRKSVTFRDMTNYQRSPSSPVKVKTEVSPSRDELNRRVEAFIKKCKEERLIETMRV